MLNSNVYRITTSVAYCFVAICVFLSTEIGSLDLKECDIWSCIAYIYIKCTRDLSTMAGEVQGARQVGQGVQVAHQT